MTDEVELRVVERFDEPAFGALVARLLHDPDRRSVAARFLDAPAMPAVPHGAREVRIGAFATGDLLVGWSHAHLVHTGVLHVSNSAVEPGWRRQGLYTRLVAAMEEQARALGCSRIESQHRAANAPVLIAKLKAGYTVVGTEFSAEMGLLVKLAKHLTPRREALLLARAGGLEGVARHFTGPGVPPAAAGEAPG